MEKIQILLNIKELDLSNNVNHPDIYYTQQKN